MRKLITYSVITLAAFAFALTSCRDDVPAFAVYDEFPIGLMLENYTETAEDGSIKKDYTLWTEMLKRAKIQRNFQEGETVTDEYNTMYSALNVKKLYTCFAVRDEGVRRWMDRKGYATIDKIPQEELETVMRYHVVVGSSIPYGALVGRLADTTATGDYIIGTVKYIEQDKETRMFMNDSTQVVTKRGVKNVINGIVHELSDVLEPVVFTGWDFLEDRSEYTIFNEALEKTKLNNVLNTNFYYRKFADEDSVKFKVRYTLFIVSDKVFNENGINSFADLHDKYAQGGTDYTNPENTLYKYISYHIIDGYYTFSDLAKFSEETPIKQLGSTPGKSLMRFTEEIVNGEKTLVINKIQDEVGYLLVKPDIISRNTVIHEIDGLLPTFNVPPVEVIIDLQDPVLYPELTQIPIYRNGGHMKEAILDKHKFPFIDYSTADRGSVKYHLRSNDFFLPNKDVYYANYNANGWWSIRVPHIAAGSYKFSYYHQRVFGNGAWQTYFDDKKVGPVISMENSYGNYSSSWTDPMDVSFTETDSHILKFDHVRAGNMVISDIKFTPVE